MRANRRSAISSLPLLVSIVASGCAAPDAQSTSVINVSNDSAIAVVLSINGTTVGRVQPGFRGPFTDVGAGSSPRTVTLTTSNGSPLSSPWDAQSGVFEFAMDPECGTITLWIGSSGASFGAPPPLDASACPS